MSSFFTIPKSQKRKRNDPLTSTSKKARTTPKANTFASRSKPLASTKRPHIANTNDDADISGSESIPSDALSDSEVGYDSGATDISGEAETAADKRRRLAEAYLDTVRAEVEQQGEGEFDAAQIDKDLIAERLREDVAETKGRLYRRIAELYEWEGTGSSASDAEEDRNVRPWVNVLRAGDCKSVTAVAAGGGFVFVATKDMRIMKWEVPALPLVEVKKAQSDQENTEKGSGQPGSPHPELSKSRRRKLRARRRNQQTASEATDPWLQRPTLIKTSRGSRRRKGVLNYRNHTAPILCLACSPSGHLLVSGGADKRIIVWDTETLKAKRVFNQHRAAVTGLAFRRNTNQLFSASADRTIKVWSLDELAYVETLFGHQDEVMDVGALGLERCISVGGRDRTARVWKVVEESQLVFRGGGNAVEKESKRDRKRGVNGIESRMEREEKKARSAHGEGSIDRVALIDDEMFVTGSDNGSICLWNVQKKKPVYIVALAHGVDPSLPLEEAFADLDMQDVEAPGPPLPRWITALAVVPYSDLVISGSWEGKLRVWRVSEDKKRLEAVGIVGEDIEPDAATVNGQAMVIATNGELSQHQRQNKVQKFDAVEEGTEELTNPTSLLSNGHLSKDVDGKASDDDQSGIRGDSVDPGRDEASSQVFSRKEPSFHGVVNDIKVFEHGERGKESIVIVAALGKEHRSGRWKKVKGQNAALVYELPRSKLQKKQQLDNRKDNEDQ